MRNYKRRFRRKKIINSGIIQLNISSFIKKNEIFKTKFFLKFFRRQKNQQGAREPYARIVWYGSVFQWIVWYESAFQWIV
jgi:hypothetical protein